MTKKFRHAEKWIHFIAVVALAATLFVSCAGLRIDRPLKSEAEDWTTFGGSPTRVNRSASSLVPPLHEIWQYDAGSGIAATPLIRDSVMLVCTLKGELHAVSIQKGKRIGYIDLDGVVAGTPVWNGRSVYLPISNAGETVESIDIDDGSLDWRTKTGDCESSPLFLDKRVYATSLDGRLYCFNAVNGDEIWKFSTAPDESREPIRSSPASDGNLIVFGCDDGFVYAVDRLDGKQRWKYKTGASIFGSPIIVNHRVVLGSLDGVMHGLDLQNGTLDWSRDLKSPIYGSPSANDTLVFVGTADGHCYALDAQRGTDVWEFQAGSVINSAPLVSGEVLFVGSLDKNLYAIQIQTGKELWRYETRGRIKVPPVTWNGILFVTSEENYVTALK